MLTFAELVIVVLFFLGGLYAYFKYKFNYWEQKGVPYRKPTFLFGNLLELALYKGYPGKFFADLYNEFEAPYIGFYSFSNPYLLIKDTELIKTILIKDFNVFSNRSFFVDKKIDPIISNSLLGIQVPEWKELRKKLSPVFSSGKIKIMTPLMLECGKHLENYLTDTLNQNLEIKEVAAKYTTDVISSCAFGLNANSFTKDSEFNSNRNLLSSNCCLQNLKGMSYIFAPIFVKIFKFPFMDATAINKLRNIFNETMAAREVSKVKRNDLVDVLMEIKDEETSEDTFKFDENRIVAQAVTYFTAGHETSSSTIAFTLHELGVNVNIQNRLREEILREIKKHGGITYEAVQDMKYLHMVLSETLRKYPLTSVLSRINVTDYKFAETGLLIKKGTTIIISLQALHWNPKYFPQPEKFDPERFSEVNKHKISNYVYLPFGDGPRNCIGERFGSFISKLCIIHVIRNFRVEKNSQTVDPIVFSNSRILTSINGIPLTCTKL